MADQLSDGPAAGHDPENPRPGGGSDVSGWFESVYARAAGDPSRVPWARSGPHPYVVGWLDQPGLEVSGVDAAVVGAGLGDDAAVLAERGCRVAAFDVSPTAVDWARRRFPDADVVWRVADLLDPDPGLRGAFGLVVDVRTLPWLPAHARDAAMGAIADLVGPGGILLTVTLVATSDMAARTTAGPPWALAPAELTGLLAGGLERLSLEHPPAGPEEQAMEVRLLHRRPR